MYHEKHDVNSAAESTLNTLAIIIHIVGIIGAVIVFIARIAELEGMVKVAGYGGIPVEVPGTAYLLAFLLSVLIYLFAGLLPWAAIKVCVNMSRSLMNISYDVEDMKEKLTALQTAKTEQTPQAEK